MSSVLAQFLRHAREALGLTRQQVAENLGYRNTTKGANRLRTLENEGDGPTGLLERVRVVLGITREELLEAQLEDNLRRNTELLEWAAAWQEPYMFLKAMPGFGITIPFPPGMKRPEELLEHAREVVRARRFPRLNVALSRFVMVYLDHDGNVTGRSVLGPDSPWWRHIRPKSTPS